MNEGVILHLAFIFWGDGGRGESVQISRLRNAIQKKKKNLSNHFLLMLCSTTSGRQMQLFKSVLSSDSYVYRVILTR